MNSHYKSYYPFVSRFDPCVPLKERRYSTPPHLFIGFQPANLPQFPPAEALRAGTLWKPFYDPYFNPFERSMEGQQT